jgi:hypothetical protein
MYVETKDIIQAPLESVFSLVRDRLPEVVPYLPNIKKIDVIKKQEDATKEHTMITNHWFANIEIPSVAKGFIKEDLFSWKDEAVWHNKDFFVEYTLISFWASDIYTAKGKNYFKALDKGFTELRVTCEVTIHPDKVPGIPSFLVKKVLPTLGPMIENVLRPNLSGLGKGLNQFFSQQS